MTVWSATRPQPSKNAGSDPEAFRLRPVMAITAAGAGSYMPDPISRILFSQFRFYKEGMGPTVQNRPGSNLDGLVGVWLNAPGLEAS